MRGRGGQRGGHGLRPAWRSRAISQSAMRSMSSKSWPSTRSRPATAPDLPSMEESGVKPFDVSSWLGLIAPKGTPKDIVDKLNKAMNAAFDKPEVKEAYAKLGAVAEKNSPQDFSKFIAAEVQNWAPIVKASGAKVE